MGLPVPHLPRPSRQRWRGESVGRLGCMALMQYEPPMAFVNFSKPEINFKRVAGGWVFRAPNPWILGNSPQYLVNDDQKVRIAAVLRTMGAVPPLAVIAASIVAVSLAVFWKVGEIGLVFLIMVLVPAVISGIAAIQRLR